MTTNELREAFLTFFEKNGHRRDRSSSLVPHNDPTLLFTNAGMNQFKDIFTGKEKRAYDRATTCQKCVRAGGKHNDLEVVGFTRRHHTFFEMLGNFSFGDYFKKDAIDFAWTFLTENIGLPKDRLWISVFEKDDEAAELWKKRGMPADRIARMGEKDNFWSMGDTGPCGPCSEIYVDRGEAYGKNETIYDGGERFLEIWNLVFMQYEKMADGSMVSLPKPSVDTGMGLERLASVVQGVDSNYLSDGLHNILMGFSKQLHRPYGKKTDDDVALRVLTDHIRSVSFLIADGVLPSNEGRGYVLRRILRRAIRYGKKLGCSKPFFYEGVQFLESEMGKAYPEISQNSASIKKQIFIEEEKFFETLEHGLKLLESKTGSMAKGETLPGAVAFQLYDTFGFPLDLTEIILKEQGMKLDASGFEKELELQRERSRSSWKGSGEHKVSEVYQKLSLEGLRVDFTGYQSLQTETKILKVLKDGVSVDRAKEGESVEMILEKTPFYPEGGGQIGDRGEIKGSEGRFVVEETRKPFGDIIVSRGMVASGSLKAQDKIIASVDEELRKKTRINHTITHVLHATLQKVLGDHIKQAGSLVRPDYLRFDFSHFQALSQDEFDRIESLVNERIIQNAPVSTKIQNLDDAIAGGAKAFFDEKYGEQVRVISVGDFSKELCGGTHAEYLGEAGLFKIISESSVASGVRRIVAVTGAAAYQHIKSQEKILLDLQEILKTSSKDLVTRVEKLIKEKAAMQKKSNVSVASDIESSIFECAGIKFAVQIPSCEDLGQLRQLSDQIKLKVKSGAVILGGVFEKKATILISVTEDIANDFKTNDLAQKIAGLVSGRGGGKPTFAQVGGPKIDSLTVEALKGLAEAHIKGLSVLA